MMQTPYGWTTTTYRSTTPGWYTFLRTARPVESVSPSAAGAAQPDSSAAVVSLTGILGTGAPPWLTEMMNCCSKGGAGLHPVESMLASSAAPFMGTRNDSSRRLIVSPRSAPSPSNTADQLRSSIACAGFVSCIRLLGHAIPPCVRTGCDGRATAPRDPPPAEEPTAPSQRSPTARMASGPFVQSLATRTISAPPRSRAHSPQPTRPRRPPVTDARVSSTSSSPSSGLTLRISCEARELPRPHTMAA